MSTRPEPTAEELAADTLKLQLQEQASAEGKLAQENGQSLEDNPYLEENEPMLYTLWRVAFENFYPEDYE